MNKAQYGIVVIVALLAGLIGGLIGSVLAPRFIPVTLLRAKKIQVKKIEIVSQGHRLATLNAEGLNFLDGGGTITASGLYLRAQGLGGGLTASPVALMLGEGDKRGIEFFLDVGGRSQMRIYGSDGSLVWSMPEEKKSDPNVAQLEQTPTSPPAIKIPPNPFTNPDPTAKVSHPACPTCYTYKGSYQVYEDVPGVPPPLGILSRDIPNPAPGYPAEVQVNARGDHEWYIGSDLRLGSTDEEPFSPALPHSTIQLKRIKVRHEPEIMGVPGVHSFGMGAKGFVVGLVPENRENRKLLPQQLEGVPIIVELQGMSIIR